ncbi:MAG: NAD(P)-dependent oxidoreductase [bacterium]|nr:NAD(P)-dependent oxidoreductase [bacterium]
MSTRLIITGSLGYIGSELQKDAKAQNLSVLPIDKDYRSGEEGLSLNLADHEKTGKAVSDFKPNVFVHAGTHSALAYKDDFVSSFTEDFQALLNIVKALASYPSCRLIYFSSSYVYSGLPKDEKMFEDRPLLPSHNFGVAKSFFEQFILRNHKNSVIFRLSSVFGEGEAKHPNTILNFAKECEEKGELTLWGTGARKIQYVYLPDVVRCVREGFTLPPGIYNLGGDEYSSVKDAAQMIADFYKASVVFKTDKPEGETLPFLGNAKLKKASAKNVFTPFSMAVTEYLNTLRPKA